MKRIFILFTVIALFSACGDNNTTGSEEEAPAEAHEEGGHEEAESNTVSLTGEQIKQAGITQGPIEMKNLRTSIKANGILSVPNQNKALITSLSSGVLKSLSIQPGSYVKKGQIVASISNRDAAPMQQELQAVFAQISLSELELQRQKDLVAGNAAPLKNVQRVQTELTTLRASRNSLQKQLIATGISPESVKRGDISTTINLRAPISGTISTVTGQIGSPIDQSTPVAEIVNNAELHLDLFVYEKDLPKLEKNQTIHFTLTNDPGKEYDAKIFSIGTAFANESKTIPIHSVVLGRHAGLIEGMNITALISVGEKKAAAVPTEAIVSEQGKDYIFVQTKAPANHAEKEEHQEEEKEHEDEAAHLDEPLLYFEKVLVVKGASDVGYTEITLMKSLPADVTVITKGAFFVLAKMSGGGGHAH